MVLAVTWVIASWLACSGLVAWKFLATKAVELAVWLANENPAFLAGFFICDGIQLIYFTSII